ncbi:adenylate/guanylate cyclase domain-containing protein [Pyxidicoccus fallax]|uniref:Adenylate/guanylate cyclase domain-containing protein n=1 Tax=Pyxidicoccus fallax TaxID=394095 RepID=A0A848LT91_9BACT|nr:adenylate/guanylate cyclase domain-containing protein [Pyxidicoccus fallax]NMO20832.1 adenylate/guanylate cyclase domain-containing protein [Pyxidicoccus fallax]NPC84227.1 adenylate/guanylate cyclase domain-containing protein [Pyxidicoccus fallax]
MTTFLSRRRFELLALVLAAAFCALHMWVERTPVVGLAAGGDSDADAPLLVRGLHLLEGRATDLQFLLRGPRAPSSQVVVVEVDERSAQAHGRWPWPRDTVALAVARLQQAGAAAVGLDITFTDEARGEDTRVWAEALRSLDRTLRDAPHLVPALEAYRSELAARGVSTRDESLAAVLAGSPGVVQGVMLYTDKEREQFAPREPEWAALLEPHLLRRFHGEVPGAFHEVDVARVPGWRNRSAQLPLPELARASQRLGHFSAAMDPDGTLRRLPVLAKLEVHGGFLPALSVQTAAAALGAQVEPVYDADSGQLSGARLRPRQGAPLHVPMPVAEPFTLINYPGPGEVFDRLSMADVLKPDFDAEALRRKVAGKAVLVGVTLLGNYDQRVTPFREFEPGVYAHAAFLSNILTQEFLTRPEELIGLELLFMVGAAVLLARTLPRVPYRWKMGVMALVGLVWFGVDQALFSRGVQVASVVPLLSLLTSSFGILFLGYRTADQEKSRLRHAFQHYLDVSVMEQVLQHPERLKLGGERKELTVLFSDIRGFTTLSEQLSPEQLVSFINAYLTPMTDVVFTHGGTLDKYIGDAIMCFWGAPVDQPDHALRACRAALGFLDRLEQLKARWRADGLPEVDIGVGINTGPMNVGHMGTESRFNYTVMGDAVNLGSRLEGLNKEYGTRVLMSEHTYAQVKGHVVARRLGAVRVKGKSQPVALYELRALGTATGADADAIRHFEEGMDRFTARDWDAAEACFHRVLGLWREDGPSRRYLDATAAFRERPPGPDWDGVFTATTK